MIVADASLLVGLLIGDSPTGQAAGRIFSDADRVCVPDLAYVETAAVVRKRWLRGVINAVRCREAVEDLMILPLSVYPTLPLIVRAFELRANVTTYDACYVALAETLQCELVTGDRRLAQATGPRCRIRTVDEWV